MPGQCRGAGVPSPGRVAGLGPKPQRSPRGFFGARGVAGARGWSCGVADECASRQGRRQEVHNASTKGPGRNRRSPGANAPVSATGGRPGAVERVAFALAHAEGFGGVGGRSSRCQPAWGQGFTHGGGGDVLRAGEAHQEGRDRRQVRCVSQRIRRSPVLSNARSCRCRKRSGGDRALGSLADGPDTTAVGAPARLASPCGLQSGEGRASTRAIHGGKRALHRVRAPRQAANRRLCGDRVDRRPTARYASAYALQAARPANTASRHVNDATRAGAGHRHALRRVAA